jgi:hypothetical protein
MQFLHSNVNERDKARVTPVSANRAYCRSQQVNIRRLDKFAISLD